MIGTFRMSDQGNLCEERPLGFLRPHEKSRERIRLLSWKNPKQASAAGTEWAKEKRKQKDIREVDNIGL